MYIRTVPGRVLICVLLMFGSVSGGACELPAGTALWLRLLTPVSSYFSKAGGEVQAILTEDLVCDAAVAVPAGTPVEGRVLSVRKVGWGFRHETASLELKFDRFHLADGSSLGVVSRVLEVENSREAVKNGVILGIRSTDTPQGTINSRLKHLPTWNPYTDAILIVYKATFPIFPEPEIWFGPGTDLRLQLVDALQVQPAPLSPPAAPTEDGERRSMVAQFPERVSTLDEKDADVVNLALVGSREQLQAAFLAAGWVTSDTFSKASFLHEFHAFLNHSGYATAPMRPMLLRNALPDMLWQKSLNTYSKRDHLRIWKSPDTLDGATVWIGASTHDDGATLSLRNKRFVHNINPQIDGERAKIMRDLKMAGCVQSVSLVDRPELPHHLQNAIGDPVQTDGRLAFIRLKDCSGPEFRQSEVASFKPGNKVFRYLRRQVLTLRSDIWRANIIYGAYDLVRLLGHTAHSIEKPPPLPEKAAPPQEMASAPADPGPNSGP